jgi:hypothetical protein
MLHLQKFVPVSADHLNGLHPHRQIFHSGANLRVALVGLGHNDQHVEAAVCVFMGE